MIKKNRTEGVFLTLDLLCQGVKSFVKFSELSASLSVGSCISMKPCFVTSLLSYSEEILGAYFKFGRQGV